MMKTTKDRLHIKNLTNPPIGGFFYAVYVLWGPPEGSIQAQNRAYRRKIGTQGTNPIPLPNLVG